MIGVDLYLSPAEDCNDGGVPGDTDDTDNGNVHPQRVNEPVGGGVDDITIAQPMRMEIESVVIVTWSPRGGHVSRCYRLVASSDVRIVGGR